MNNIKSKRNIYIGIFILIIIIVFIFLFTSNKDINSTNLQDNISYAEQKSNYFFEQYIENPVLYVWNSFGSWIYKTTEQTKNNDSKIYESKIEKIIKPDKVNKYFGTTTEEDLNKIIQ